MTQFRAPFVGVLLFGWFTRCVPKHQPFARCVVAAPSTERGSTVELPSSQFRCQRVAEHPVLEVAAVETCAGMAWSMIGSENSNGLNVAVAFHLLGVPDGGAHCSIERCLVSSIGTARQASALEGPPPIWPQGWTTYAPLEFCPLRDGRAAGNLIVLPDLSEMLVGSEQESLEFAAMFGPTPLRHDQQLHGFSTECSHNIHAISARVCYSELPDRQCDVLSKHSLPRCHVSLAFPSDHFSSGFLYAPSCERIGQFYCSPSVPLALRVTLKAGSRSAIIWAAMLENLLPSLIVARRTLAAALSEGVDGSNSGRLARYVSDWLERDEVRLNCSQESALFSISRALHRLSDEASVGLPLSLCPTCCQTAAGRLQVVFIRNPAGRLWSFYNGYWGPQKAHLLPGGFFAFLSRIIPSVAAAGLLGLYDESIFEGGVPTAINSSLFEPSDLQHVAPTFIRPSTKDIALFSIDHVPESMRRLEAALCDFPWRRCGPLPPFPPGHLKNNVRSPPLPATLRELIDKAYKHDMEALRSFSW